MANRMVIITLFVLLTPQFEAANNYRRQTSGSEYLPPRNEFNPQAQTAHSSSSALSNSYGVPGHTPGQPLGLRDSESKSVLSNDCPPNDPKFNLALVKRAYQEALGDKNTDNLEMYFHQDYIQHAVLVPDGLDGLKKFINQLKSNNEPKFQLMFARTAAQDDLVWTHTRFPALGKVFAAVDIFRVECGKIKEHWDVLQDTDLRSMPAANPHPFFK